MGYADENYDMEYVGSGSDELISRIDNSDSIEELEIMKSELSQLSTESAEGDGIYDMGEFTRSYYQDTEQVEESHSRCM